jgi:NTE family protein
VWVTRALQNDLETAPARYDRAKSWKAYEDADARPYIHLIDGGIADNIGLRGVADAITTTDGDWSILRKIDLEEIDRLAVIVVDAKPEAEPERDRSAHPPWFGDVLETAATKPMENYSSDSVQLMDEEFHEWRSEEQRTEHLVATCDRFARGRAQACYDAFGVSPESRPHRIDVYEIHVRFEALRDPKLQRAAERIATRLQLSRAEVELVTKLGATLLDESPEFRRLIGNLTVSPAPR